MDLITFYWVEKSCSAFINLLYLELLYSSVLFIFIWGLAYIMKGKSPYWQFGLWVLILVRLVLPPDISFPFSARNLLARFPIISKINTPVLEVPNKLQRKRLDHSQIKWAPVTEGHLQRPDNAQINHSGIMRSGKYVSWTMVLTMIWFAGFLLSLFIFWRRLACFGCVIKRASPIENDSVAETIRYWRQKFKIRRAIQIVSSDEYLSPFTIGIFRPKIFIPLAIVKSKDTATIQSIAAHEMVHIKRLDDLWIRLQNLFQIFYFFHPVVWYANRQINFARERICDSRVLSNREILPKAYGEGILNVLKLHSVGLGVANPLPGFGNHRKNIEQRIRNVMKGDIMKKQDSLFVFAMIVLIGMFLLPMSPIKTNASQEKITSGTEQAESLKPMEGWFASKFDPGIHQKEKLPRALQSNEKNPFIKTPHSQRESFQQAIDKGLRPGVNYYTGGSPVRAVAAGIVHFVGERQPGKDNIGGLYVRVAHDDYDGLKEKHYPRVTLYRNQAYRSTYYNLSRVVVTHWQTVKRGQIIGYGMKFEKDGKECANLVLEERGNWVNPDDYGLNHSFLTYWDGGSNLEISLEEMNSRLDAQLDIVKRLYSFYSLKGKYDIYAKLHAVIDTEKYKNYPVRWSTQDRFRYLESLKDRKIS